MSLNPKPAPSPRDTSAATSRLQVVEPLRERLLHPGRHWVLVSVAMYALACVLPAFPGIMGDPVRGWACLIFGAFWFPSWWANPTYFIAVIASLLNRTRIAVVFAIVAALLAVSYELMSLYDRGTMEDLLPGCLMWVASLQLLACHELWRLWLTWQRRVQKRELGPADSA